MGQAEEMVGQIRQRYDLDAPNVFLAMLKIPREEFVPHQYSHLAYTDSAISIGHGQTISQPYTVAFMTNLLDLVGNEKVLEIGTGSGYQAAILSLLAEKVYTIERIPELGEKAKKLLKKLGFKNIEVRVGTGELGWKEKAPFDAIIVTAGVEEIPKALFDQLNTGGVLVAPLGKGSDKVMTKFTKRKGKIVKEEFGVFHFVPFVESS